MTDPCPHGFVSIAQPLRKTEQRCPFCHPAKPEELTMTDETARLERDIAEITAMSDLKRFCQSRRITGRDYWDADPLRDGGPMDMSVRYLELRGLLERHPERPELVRFVEKEHA